MTSQDDLPTLPLSERLYEWEKHFERVQDIEEYAELNNEFQKLKSIVLNKGEISPEDDKEFRAIVRTQWNWIIRDGSDHLLEIIETRKTKGQVFSKIIKQINHYKMDGQKEHPLIEYEDIFSKLLDLADEVKESIFSEQYLAKQNWKFTIINIVIGAIIGFILSILTGILLKFWGIC
jgi:DNA-directed RNA polymerase subunit F